MPSYKDDRRVIAFNDLPLEVEAIDVRKLDIEDETCGDIRLFRRHVVAGRCKGAGVDSVRGQKFAQCLSEARIVVHDEHNMFVRRHAAAVASTGSAKTNVAPCGVLFSAQSRPPWDSTIERQMASPMPIPRSFVVKKGSNIFSDSSIPGPLSLSSTRMASSIKRTRRRSSLLPGTEPIASIPFRMRFIRTC